MDKNLLLSRIESLANEQGKNLTTVFVESGAGKNFKSNMKTAEPSLGKITLIANYLGTTADYLIGKTDKKEKPSTKIEGNAIFLDNINVYMAPLFESVSAGFGTNADDHIVDYIPCYVKSSAEASQTLCIKVKGDSMFPKIEDGDIVQVHKQTSVDSGSLAVVLLDGEEGLVKKVVYGDNWIELHSINPMYPVQRFEGEDAERIQILGLVKRIIKEV